VSVLNQRVISKAYFMPQPHRCSNAIEVDVGDAVLRCHHHVANNDGRTLIHFHGNGEAVAQYVDGGYPEMISSSMRDVNVLMVEYRGYGGSSGDVEMVSMLADGQRVMDQLKIDPAKTIVYGRSIGSLYALELVKRLPNIAGLVIDSGIADIKERFLARTDITENISNWEDVDREIESHFDHRAKIERYEGKVVLMHAYQDALVESSHADRMFRWASNANAIKYSLYMYGDHNSIFQINYASMLEHLKHLESELFSSSDAGKLTLASVPEGNYHDQGRTLRAENLAAANSEEKETPSPRLFSRIKKMFAREEKE